MSSHQYKVLIDTDPGVDDAMAVLFACVHPAIDVVGLTSIFGNVTTDVATRNALVLAELTGQNIAVARGADTPLAQASRPVADFVHGVEGFGTMAPRIPKANPVELSAAEFICAKANEHRGELVLCPIGPLTNIANALKLDPALTEKVARVVVMGGSIDAGGNATPYAEANIWQDPNAAAAVFKADWDVTLVGLDVTHDVICAPSEFDQLAKDAPILGGFLNEASQFYFRFHEKHDGFYGCHMHDPTAVIAIVYPQMFTCDDLPIDVVTGGKRVGQTYRVDTKANHSIHCALQVQAQSVRDVFLDTLSASF